MGTHCVDNSPTVEANRGFLQALGERPAEGAAARYEFMADFQVHVDRADGTTSKSPYMVLPGTVAKASIAPSCLTCFDYVNGAADLVVGYMGAPLNRGESMRNALLQVTVRNPKGAAMLGRAERAGTVVIEADSRVAPLPTSGDRGKTAKATTQADSIVLEMLGEAVRDKGMPRPLAKVLAFVLRRVAPKGLEFAKYSIEYHFLRNDLASRDAWGTKRALSQMPAYAKAIVAQHDEWMDELRERIAAKRD
mmetsp:Transcript_29155/g.93328  ORF Transcript_29155/g.93328 Transcript_29155/m.93328 type:complete len:250 (+) Transcript_29155:479-1228(+)